MRVAAALVVLAVAVSGWAEPAKEAEGSSAVRVVVRVQNYADVPKQELQAAEAEAQRILGRAGVFAEWTECNPRNPVPSQPCEQGLAANEFNLSLLPEKMARGFGQRDTVYGFAAPCERTAATCYAYVFDARIDATSEQTISHAALLGHVAAHELGHLLLYDVHHSASGIMTARWGEDELRAAAKGDLLFFHSQAERMRAGLRARDLAAAAAEGTAAGARERGTFWAAGPYVSREGCSGANVAPSYTSNQQVGPSEGMPYGCQVQRVRR